MGYVLISGIFALMVIIQAVLHQKERKDLYNRIMSQDLGEYRLMSTRTQPKTNEQNYMKKNIENAYRSLRGGDTE